VDPEKEAEIHMLHRSLKELKKIRWLYLEGPGGRGRSHMAMTNSTGCSSVWGSTYPYNPYPFPWVNHLFQDAPSIAIGIFEGHMRKMGDNFIAVRRAELQLSEEYDGEVHEPEFVALNWKGFTEEEFDLCPPLLAMGGDGAMLDIGFQNLSRLLASGKPIRVVVLDTQVYSNTGGQACTSGFTGQVADMSAYGKAQHGKEETRKELALIALAHRGAYVLQTSQASPSHMIAGIVRGLKSRRPAVFNLYTPCPVEHGLADELALHAARLALESRAFPFMIYDPEAGDTWDDCVSLEGNPDIEDLWPAYDLIYVDDEGQEQTMELPLTIGDWAATENRFRKHFKRIKKDDWDEDDQLLFHEFVELNPDDRVGKTPFIYVLGSDRTLERSAASMEMVQLAEDRLLFWSQLKQLAGHEVSPSVRDMVADQLEGEFDKRADALRGEYEAKLAELKAGYPQILARRLAEGLLKASANGRETVADLLAKAESATGLPPITLDRVGEVEALDFSSAPAAAPGAQGDGGVAVAVEAPPAAVDEEDEGLAIEAYIDTARCTTCNECTNLNKKMFAYNDSKQAYIKDAKAGTFQQLVKASELCPARIIHPGTPLNPKEKDLDKWIKRAEPFN
jgi:pyruvate-ferredoxin/flavodoxin oxidoreductase